MTDAGFVIAGWGITAAALGAYAARVAQRTRRARRLSEAPEDPNPR